jgi:hypothetical protein
MATIPTIVTTMITTNPKLNDSNWFTWIKKMKMVFLAAGLDGIASGSAPSEKAQKDRWDKLDSLMLPHLYMAIEEDFQYLVEDEDTASAGWAKLKDHFQRSTLGARMVARKEFYDITHNPNRPISQYVQSVLAAKSKLVSLGCAITDTEVMDVLLMRLDPSYHPVRITILSQKSEPKLEDVKAILTASSASHDVIIKSEPVEELLAAARVDHSKRVSQVDDKGLRWCDTDRDGVCHRCGRPGHIAARCMYSMPQSIKDWIINSRLPSPSPSQEKASYASAVYQNYDYDSDSDSGVGPWLI